VQFLSSESDPLFCVLTVAYNQYNYDDLPTCIQIPVAVSTGTFLVEMAMETSLMRSRERSLCVGGNRDMKTVFLTASLLFPLYVK
jgi:hypothetical protein